MSESRPIRIVEPYAHTRHVKIPTSFQGVPLIDFLSERYPYRSRAYWAERVQAGDVRIEGSDMSHPEDVFKRASAVTFFTPRVVEPTVPDEVGIVGEGEGWVAVQKPAPMPVHPGGRYFKNTCLAITEELLGQKIYPVHRLDAVTSGLVVFATDDRMASTMTQALSEGRVEKEYRAHVFGRVEDDEQIIDQPIRRKSGFVFESVPLEVTAQEAADTEPTIESSKSKGRGNLKQAQTLIRVLERGQDSSLVQCIPLTGRTHQIRLHCQAMGHPILEDPIYGPDGDASGKTLQNGAIRLQHAAMRWPTLGISLRLDPPSGWKV
ncbi:MAG: RluA family pseudouridine synthase [Rhodothermaceae bacterium TMED105]|nr:MAG: RluA family pseudouridine synthase [Rhodothermaceae bacterium TMED105]